MRRLLLGAALLVLTGCGTTTPPSVVTPFQTGQEPSPIAPKARTPERLRMWHFAAPVVPVHAVGRELVPPADPTVLGWWGRRAGAQHGATLIVGHAVHTGGGELDQLASTPVGAVAVVSGIRYRVTSVRVMVKAQLARRAAHLFSRDGPPRLVVVSCADYDWSTGVWPANAVVVAEPIRGAA